MKKKLFSESEGRSVVKVASNDGLFDVIYPHSSYVIIREVPFLGRRFVLAQLKSDMRLFNRICELDGNDSEYLELLNNDDLEDTYYNVLCNRFKVLKSVSGLKLKIPCCMHYHILKEGKITRKAIEMTNKDKITLKFKTSYIYHLVEPITFLKVYKNRQNSRPKEDAWDVLQEDIHAILDKSLIGYITGCDYAALNEKYQNMRFEKVLLKAKSQICHEFGIYIDDVIMEEFVLPEPVTTASANLDGELIRKQAQLEAAGIDAEIEKTRTSAAAEVALENKRKAINALGGEAAFCRISAAEHLRAYINIGGDDNFGLFGGNGNYNYHKAQVNAGCKTEAAKENKHGSLKPDDEIITALKNLCYSNLKVGDLESPLSDYVFNHLKKEMLCNEAGMLSFYCIYFIIVQFAREIHSFEELKVIEYFALIEHFKYLDSLSDDRVSEIVDQMYNQSIKRLSQQAQQKVLRIRRERNIKF